MARHDSRPSAEAADLDEDESLDDDELDEDEADEDEADEDEEDEDEEDEGDDADDDPGPVTAERLRDLEEWEMFRLVDEDEMVTVCTIALRPEEKARAVEYAIWREEKDQDEPGSTGTVEWAAGSTEWDDKAREDAIRQVVYRYEEDLKVPEERLELRLVGPPAGWNEEDSASESAEEHAGRQKGNE